MAEEISQSAPTELGDLKISKLLTKFAVPGIIAQTAASLYNMVDSIYIGHIPGAGAYAISGLAVTFPLMNLSIAAGTLVGVGAMTMISVLLGQKNYPQAQKVLANVLSLNVIVGVLFMAVTLAFLDPILRFFGATDNTLPYAHDYMFVILLGNVITHLFHGFNGAIRSSGHPKTAMGLTLFTVISNAILDPIFIFTFGLGIKGAAIATILCQFLALIYTFKFLADKKRFLHFPRPLFQLDWEISRKSMAIGLGPCLMNSASCLVVMFINQQLLRYSGDLAIGAYGIVNRITMLFFMVCMGFNQGLQPIAGYNFGARKYSRVREIYWLTAKWETLIMFVCLLVSELCPGAAVALFTNDPELHKLATGAMRVMNAGIAFVGFGMVSGNFFQCLGMVKTSIFLSLSRQILILIPLIYALPLLMQETGVWLSFPISDAIASVVAAIFITRIFKKMGRLKDGDDPSSLGGLA